MTTRLRGRWRHQIDRASCGKCEDDSETAAAAAVAVAKRLRDGGDHRCIVSSFNRDVLVALRLQLPSIPMALIAEALPDDGVAFCQQHGLEGMHLDGHQVTYESARAVLDGGPALLLHHQ